MGSNKGFSFLRLVLLLGLVLLCLAAAAAGLAVYRLPQMAAQKFGPPGGRLDLIDRTMYSMRLLANEDNLLVPLDPQGSERPFAVTLGEPVSSIATRLEEDDFIASADAFRTYLVYAGLDTGVQAGRYQLSPAAPAVEIARELQDAVPEEVVFNILPGWRAEEIAGALPTSGLTVTPEDFLEIVNNPPDDIVPPGFPLLSSLEGFLMPGSYQIKRDTSTRDLAALFVNRFAEQVTPEMQAGFTSQGLDLLDAVILASIVQREAVVAEEQPAIASVFYNRLANGMKLESDPTAQYALGYQPDSQSWWKSPLSQADLQVDSRYNTYSYPGLPPGPIANPGTAALWAVANPEQTDYFFFRARCDGSRRHAFAVTYEEHLQNACP